MATYLIEAYAPRARRPAADQLGPAVHVREEIYLAVDELWFCVVEAASRRDVEQATERVGLVYDRLSEAE